MIFNLISTTIDKSILRIGPDRKISICKIELVHDVQLFCFSFFLLNYFNWVQLRRKTLKIFFFFNSKKSNSCDFSKKVQSEVFCENMTSISDRALKITGLCGL